MGSEIVGFGIVGLELWVLELRAFGGAAHWIRRSRADS